MILLKHFFPPKVKTMANPFPSVLFLLVLLVRLVTSQNNFLARVDRLKDAIVLNCTDEEVLPPGTSVQYWIEPQKFELLYPGNSVDEMEVGRFGARGGGGERGG